MGLRRRLLVPALTAGVLLLMAGAWSPAAVLHRTHEPAVPILDFRGVGTGAFEKPLPLGGLDFITILVVGIDSVRHVDVEPGAGLTFCDIPIEAVRGRTDTIMILGLDRRTQTARLLHIPRDTIVSHPGRGEDKIGHYISYFSFFNLKAAVENLLQIPIHRYALVDFGGFKTLVDAIGGVTVTVDHDLMSPSGVWLPRGTHRLDGAGSLRFVRHRYGEREADIARIRNQKSFLVALAKELRAGGFKKVFSAYMSSPMVVKTNIAAGDILRLWREWGDFDPETLEHMWLPGHPESHHWRVDPVKLRGTVKEFWPDTPTAPSPPGDEPDPGSAVRLLRHSIAAFAGVDAGRLWELAYYPFLRPHRATRPPTVLIYHTHTSESFMPQLAPDPAARAGMDPNTSAFSSDPEISIARIGQELARALDDLGLETVHFLTVHDGDGLSGAYERSKQTVEAALQTLAGPVIILDIHRDAVTGRAPVGGKHAAGILFIVARQNPWWQWNYTFARNLDTALEAAAPGLSRGVRILDGRYNADLSPLALLVEVGGAESTMEECFLSTYILAGVIADYVGGP